MGTTFRTAAEELHTDRQTKWRSDNHRRGWLSSMRTYVFPAIGDMPVSDVDTPAVLKVLRPLWLTQYDTARRLRQRIETVLDRATAMKLREGDNPARWSGHLEHLLPARDETEQPHHKALPWREAPAFMARVRELPGVDAKALEFLVLTATRAGEAMHGRWDEIEDDVWTIPAHRMKGGKEHRVPLSRRALDLLASLPRDGGPYIFPGAREGKPMAKMALARVLERLDVDTTVHGLRSTFRDWAGEETSFPNHIAEMALAHSVGKVEGAYRRGELMKKRRQLAEAWAGFIGGGNVVDLAQWRA
jgi:integrase